MAGHSQFKNIMHRKGAQDKKRGKIFTKLIREITTAAKSGGAPDSNPRLRSALATARANNMSREIIERAVSRGTGGAQGDNYDEVRYEGYGAGGVAVIVEALTDNRNRTAGEVRSAFTKYGGNLGETNSVAFSFEQVGEIIFPKSVASAEDIFEAVIEAGADNVESYDETHEVTTSIVDLNKARDALAKKYGEPESCKIVWRAKTETPVSGDLASALFKMIEALEDLDDVQQVYTNMNVDDATLKSLDVA